MKVGIKKLAHAQDLALPFYATVGAAGLGLWLATAWVLGWVTAGDSNHRGAWGLLLAALLLGGAGAAAVAGGMGRDLVNKPVFCARGEGPGGVDVGGGDTVKKAA